MTQFGMLLEMPQKPFYSNALTELLEIGGDDMRDPFLAQLMQDFTRCHSVFVGVQADGTVPAPNKALSKCAHEVKGLALTIGGTDLAELAQRLESACAAQDVAALRRLLPQVTSLTGQTIDALADMAQAT